MIKRIMFVLLASVMLSASVGAKLSPALEIIGKKIENRPCIASHNLAPYTEDVSVDTQSGIAVFKSFGATDPEGDSVSFEVVSYPSHGSIEITDCGQFVYRPLSGYSGKDEFSYRAVDTFGASSDERIVTIKVSRPAADVYFKDMENHWAHNSAIKMASTGLMPGDVDDGEAVFNPEAEMTRGDFLALSLIMAGHEEQIPYVSKTVFADDSTIAHNIKSYVQYAYDKGIISGYDNGDGTINFEPACSVTRAEAAVITDKILELEASSEALPSYKDAQNIPVWAYSAVCALSEAGILDGNPEGYFCGDRMLTRAEGAEIICNVADYVEDKKQDEKKKEKNIFNLFGLLG